MPISQETLLLIYGELRMLVDRIELLETASKLPYTAKERAARLEAANRSISQLAIEARLSQRVAIARLLDDEPSMPINPLDGTVEAR